jgi:hypothetical protein
MAMQDLFQALQMFQQGVQQAAIYDGVNNATAQMQQIQQSAVDEGQKRQQFQQLANQTALRLTGAGANGSQIQSAFNAINPQNFGSAEQMQIEGDLSGNKQLQDVSGGIIQERRNAAASVEDLDFKRKLLLQDRQLQQQMALERMKMSEQKPDLSTDELGFQTNVQVAEHLINDLDQTIVKFGTAETGWGSKEAKNASSKLDAIPYQLAITYAKIVDPGSVAREGEVAAAQKYMLNLGAFSSPEKAREALKNMKATIQQYRKARGNTQQAAGIEPVGGKQGPAAPVPQVRKLNDGSYAKVIQLQNGKWEVVD